MSLDEIKAKALKTIEAQMKTPRRYPQFFKVPQKTLVVGLITKMPEWRKIKGRERLLLEWNVEGVEYTLDCTPVVLQQKVQELMVQGLLKNGSMLWVYNAGPDQGRRWHHWFAGAEPAPGAQT